MASEGYIEIIFGPMFSSKTIELISRYNKYSDIGKKCIFINNSQDVRNPNCVISLNTESIICENLTINGCKTDSLSKIDVNDYDVILIDEAHFFDDLISSVRHWSESMNKCVIVAGLIATSERAPFGHILNLLPFASKVTHLTAICTDCMKNNNQSHFIGKFPAPFTAYKGTKIDEVEIGSSDKYKAVCRYHYLHNALTN